MQTSTLPAVDGTALAIYSWPIENPKAVVQIAHGMAEHAARYDEFAQALNAAGYAVYAQDHRGHGKTAGSTEALGHFADSDGWAIVVRDMVSLTSKIREDHPGMPIFLFGHSMGSMLARTYIQERGGDLAGVIISGTAGDPGALGKVGALVAGVEGRIRGLGAKSKLMDAMSFGAYNKEFKPNRTAFDWLSRDPAQVDAYVDDPYCGNLHSARFWVDILGGMAMINDPAKVARVPGDLPVLVFSGTKDPVGGKDAADVRKVARQLREAGVADVTETYYPDGRHESLNETNREQVYADVIAWLDAHQG